MSHTAVRLLAAATVLAVACTDPTVVCGCSLVPASAVVTGRVVDRADAPVVGAARNDRPPVESRERR